MAKALNIILLIVIAILVAGCVNPVPGTCQAKGDACCKWNVCTVTDVSCMQGTEPVFSGCDKDCTPIARCVPKASN